MRSSVRCSTLTLGAAVAALTMPASAQERSFDLGVRLGVVVADGVPANDIPGAGIIAHYELNDRWLLGAAVDRTEYDFEEPAKLVGIAQDPQVAVIDALAEATIVSLWIERALTERMRPTRFFVGAGLGAAFVDVPDAAGPRADGGLFDIHTEADTEIVVSILVGVRRRFGSRWYGEVALRAEQHFADWQVTDRISGARGSIDDYFTWGAHAAVGVRF